MGLSISLSPGTIPAILQHDVGRRGLRQRQAQFDAGLAEERRQFDAQAEQRRAEVANLDALSDEYKARTKAILGDDQRAQDAADTADFMKSAARLQDAIAGGYGDIEKWMASPEYDPAYVDSLIQLNPNIRRRVGKEHLDAMDPAAKVRLIMSAADQDYRNAQNFLAATQGNNAEANAHRAGQILTNEGLSNANAVSPDGVPVQGGPVPRAGGLAASTAPGGAGADAFNVSPAARGLVAGRRLGYDPAQSLDAVTGNPVTERGAVGQAENVAGIRAAPTLANAYEHEDMIAQQAAERAAAARAAEITAAKHPGEVALARQQSEDALNATYTRQLQNDADLMANRLQFTVSPGGDIVDHVRESLGYNVDPDASPQEQVAQMGVAIVHDAADTASRNTTSVLRILNKIGIDIGKNANPRDTRTWSNEARRVLIEAVAQDRVGDERNLVTPDKNRRGQVPSEDSFRRAVEGIANPVESRYQWVNEGKAGLTAAGEATGQAARRATGKAATSDIGRATARTANRSIDQLGEYADGINNYIKGLFTSGQ